MKKLFFLGLSLIALNATAQSVAINTDGSTADPSAILDLKSTNQGVLVPRLTQTQRTAIATPATGLMVYQTDAPSGFYFYNGSAWAAVGGGGGTSLPSQTGNAGKFLTTDGTNASWGTGGLAVYDANNVRLGAVNSVNAAATNPNANIVTSTGHYISVYLLEPVNDDNYVGSQIYWTTSGCTGTPYLNAGSSTIQKRWARSLVYSQSANKIYTLSNPNAVGLASSAIILTNGFLESNTCSTTSSPISQSLFPLTEVASPASVGLPSSIAYPCSIR